MFNYLKKKKFNESKLKSISFRHKSEKIDIIPIGFWILKNQKLLKLVNQKRRKFNHFFISDISKNINKTKLFFTNILKDKNMCLFLIKSKINLVDGIIGIKLEKKIIEIYFVLKLSKSSNMGKSLKNIIFFLEKNHKIKNLIVKVFSNNLRAKKLYFNQGFKKFKKNYLKKIKINGMHKHTICKKNHSNVNYNYETLKLKV